MRRIKGVRRELADSNIRDSNRQRTQLGYLAAPYDGGKFVRVALTEDGFGEVTAKIPTFLKPPASRPAGSPVTVRLKRGFADVLSWQDPNPVFFFTQVGMTEDYAEVSDLVLNMEDDYIEKDDLDMWVSASGGLLMPDGWDGLWSVQCSIKWEANATGYRRLWVDLNGTAAAGNQHESVTNLAWWQTAGRDMYLSDEDVIKFYVRHTAGAALELNQLHVSVRFLRP